jgi:hypothetical protein
VLRRRLAAGFAVVACFAAAVGAFQAAADFGNSVGSVSFQVAGGPPPAAGGNDSVVAIGPDAPSSGPASPPSASQDPGTSVPSSSEPPSPDQPSGSEPGSSAPGAPGAPTAPRGSAASQHPTAAPPAPHTTAKPAPRPTTTTKPAPPPSSVDVGGTVTCMSGNSVEGVWVQADQGSGFAPWQGIGDGSTSSYWYTLPLYENYSLHVGCGGSTSDWGVALTTQQVGGTHNSFVCHDVAGDSDYGVCFLG